jgi:hypothetical protein
MRFAYVVLSIAVALGTSHAWAQPAVPAPAEPTVGDKPPEPIAPKPEPKPEPKPIDPTLNLKPDAVHSQPALALDTVPRNPDGGFRFGSYGRVIAGTDLRGGKPERILVVAHGPRIVEPSYLELEFSYGFEIPNWADHTASIAFRPVVTLAFDDTLFHDTGEFDAHPAIRNLFVDGRLSDKLSIWVGSRMYRGDDIYLFDYWPLDDLNTVGAGVLYKSPLFSREANRQWDSNELELRGHVGWNRLKHPFQFQQIDVANPLQGSTTVVQLNRQRMLASASATFIRNGPPNDVSLKVKVHGELHSLPSGTRKRDDGTLEALPSDTGLLVGAEASFFNLGGAQVDSRFRRHINVYARYAKGLAAFDELAPPTSFGPDLKTQHATELTFGTSSNWDSKLGNVMLGALARRFTDASGNDISPNNGWEYAIDVRPLVKVSSQWFAGADVSYQARFPHGLNPNTLRAEDASVFQIAPMAVFSPMGPSAYDRPQLRFVYRASHLNEGALDLYVPDDPRHAHAWVHFLGVQAEWWFNSSTYQ